MENSERRILSDEEANKMLNEILEEDKKENLNSDNNDGNEDDESEYRNNLSIKFHPRFVMKLLENEYHLIGPNAISMNQTTCARGRRDCTMSSPVRTPKRRRKRIDKGDYCECETTTDEEPEPTSKSRKVSINKTKRGSRRQHEEREEIPECSCNERVDEDECVCEDQVQRSTKDDSRVQEERETLQENSDRRTNEERQTRITRDSLVESRREETDRERRRTVETDDRVTMENDRLNMDDIYNELRDRMTPSEAKKREKELKAWLKRCQEECKRQEKRRGRHN
ncbi:uncharacterized protein LOC122537491 [Frieseomelitta varia]|uniref:uncharacterized protein LOC122537491 n=1 Tax=Frieseomelitta varia TaxID=561572 RepID=UPI001CB67CE2|nr:uncharacterized protein LOC122537491 [Frieseomelitta varia]